MALRAVTSNGVAITPSSLTVSGTLTGSSGTATAASISPTTNQSGTAGYTAFEINPTEAATGSGTKLLQRWAVGGSTLAQMSNGGFFGATAGVVVGNSGGIGFASGLSSVTQDVYLARDAAETLALRHGANPQIFRVYNTYTDASNYERILTGWSGSSAFFITESAGTGVARDLIVGTSGAANLNFRTDNTNRWRVQTSTGHFVAIADNTYDIGASGANRPRALYLAGGITHGSATLLTTTTALTNGAAAATGTLTNAPTAGNPTKWIPINDNGTTRYIPAW